jgi:hypothetical protein
MPKLIRKDGKLTRYGFVCGYVEHRHNVIISCINSSPFVLRIWWKDTKGKFWSETATGTVKARQIAANHYTYGGDTCS